MNKRFFTAGLAALSMTIMISACSQSPSAAAPASTVAPHSKQAVAHVIEIATLNLKEGVSFVDFLPVDHAVETQHVAQQPGFVSRETAKGDTNEWVVIVHWESIEAAEASMASFGSAPAAGNFMSMIDPASMVMNRYHKN